MPSAFVVPHQTALHGAAEHGFTPFVKFLAEHGADLSAPHQMPRRIRDRRPVAQYTAGSPLSVGLAITFLNASLTGTLRLMFLGGIGLRNHFS